MHKNFYISFFTFIFLLAPFAFIYAASVGFDAPATQVHQGDSFLTSLSFSSANDSVNALSGAVSFSDTLSFQGIEYDNSVVPLWIERPTYGTTTNEISFSGIIPGGLEGAHQVIFTLLFSAEKEGDAMVSVDEMTLLKNDGLGTEITASSLPLTFTIAPVAKYPQRAEISDTIPPEQFTPLISRSDSLFGGKYFVSFDTTDKDSGIDHFEIAETFLFPPSAGDWKIATSPYELSNQSGIQKVYVKAVDKSGNIRVEMVYAPHHRLALIIFVIIILELSICVYLIYSRRFSTR